MTESAQLPPHHQELFDRCLTAYEKLPSYKKVLNSMIKFEEMYRPIGRTNPFTSYWGMRDDINAERAWRRAKVGLNRRDLVQAFDETHGKRLVVTSRGHKIFYKEYPLAKLRKQKWDGVWTLVMYDFPEEKRTARNYVRRRLMHLGFGCPQISTLISPLPIEEPVQKLLEGEGVSDWVWTLQAQRVLGMENRAVARKAWPIIPALNELYRELLRMLPKTKNNKALAEQWRARFLAVNNADPYLPAELLPRDWKGQECEREFVKLGRAGFLRALLGGF